MTGYYDLRGNFIQGATVGGVPGQSMNTIEMEAQALATWCEETGSDPRIELKKMFQKHQVLKTEQWHWPDNPHPLSPLIAMMVKEAFQ